MRLPTTLTILTLAVSQTLPTAASAHTAMLPVVSCPTTFGYSGPHPGKPGELTVTSNTTTEGLAAYSNTQDYLLAPADMSCAGFVAADGVSSVTTWPRGDAKPGHYSHEAGLTLFIEPACASCRAAEACPFFSAFARSLGFPCGGGIPTEEKVYRLRSNIALFEDPPGVRGSGWPSGGGYTANGLVGIENSPAHVDKLVFRSTCTLPVFQRPLCTTSLNQTIDHYA